MNPSLKSITLLSLLFLWGQASATAPAPDAPNPRSVENVDIRSGKHNEVVLLAAFWNAVQGDGWGGIGGNLWSFEFNGGNYTQESFELKTWEETDEGWIDGVGPVGGYGPNHSYNCTIYSDPSKTGKQILRTLSEAPFLDDEKKYNPYQVGGDEVIIKAECVKNS